MSIPILLFLAMENVGFIMFFLYYLIFGLSTMRQQTPFVDVKKLNKWQYLIGELDKLDISNLI